MRNLLMFRVWTMGMLFIRGNNYSCSTWIYVLVDTNNMVACVCILHITKKTLYCESALVNNIKHINYITRGAKYRGVISRVQREENHSKRP